MIVVFIRIRESDITLTGKLGSTELFHVITGSARAIGYAVAFFVVHSFVPSYREPHRTLHGRLHRAARIKVNAGKHAKWIPTLTAQKGKIPFNPSLP